MSTPPSIASKTAAQDTASSSRLESRRVFKKPEKNFAKPTGKIDIHRFAIASWCNGRTKMLL
jgi:hypothetical protein